VPGPNQYRPVGRGHGRRHPSPTAPPPQSPDATNAEQGIQSPDATNAEQGIQSPDATNEVVNNLLTQVHRADGKRRGARLRGITFHILLDCIQEVKPQGGGGEHNAWNDVHVMFRRRMQEWHNQEIRHGHTGCRAWQTFTVDAIRRRWKESLSRLRSKPTGQGAMSKDLVRGLVRVRNINDATNFRARMVLNEKTEICEEVEPEAAGGKAPRRALATGGKKRANPYRRLAQDKLEARHAQLESSAAKFKTKYDTAAGRLALAEEELAKRRNAAEA